MEFDKSKVYTALNADELKVGSKVIVADDLSHLKDYVKDELICTLEHVTAESEGCRFVANGSVLYSLAYLVSEPEKKKLKWNDFKVGDVIKKKLNDGYRFALVEIIDTDTYCETDLHVYAADEWLSKEELAEWEKVDR